MIWVMVGGHTPDALGLLPGFFSEDDPRPAREQIDERYVSGWNPMPGMTLRGMVLHYPGDPPFYPIAMTTLHGKEAIVLYEHEILAIIQDDQSFEAARVD